MSNTCKTCCRDNADHGTPTKQNNEGCWAKAFERTCRAGIKCDNCNRPGSQKPSHIDCETGCKMCNEYCYSEWEGLCNVGKRTSTCLRRRGESRIW